MTKTWDKVRRELDIWKQSRMTAQFWWRDDDAITVTPQLRSLVELASQFRLTVGLSVIPVEADKALAGYVRQRKELDVLVHGLAHENHAGAGHAKIELGGARPIASVLADIETGVARCHALFGKKALPVLVPPWNRISRRVLPHLQDLGICGLSTWKAVDNSLNVEGVVRVNTHLDVINWRAGKTIKSEGEAAGLLLRKLKWRRSNNERAREPIGVLSHHLRWDGDMERVLTSLMRATVDHPAVRWRTPRQLFGG